MIAFEVRLNGKKICTAGVGNLGVLSACMSWRGSQPYERGGSPVPEYLRLDVGGLTALREDVRWIDRKIKSGDMVTIKVVEAPKADKPRKRKHPNPAEDLRRQRKYVRRMAKRWGWKIQS